MFGDFPSVLTHVGTAYDRHRLLAALQKKRTHFDEVEDRVLFGTDGWKTRYFKQKFKIEDDAEVDRVRLSVSTEYLRGLQWVLQYYYKGCQSWKWLVAGSVGS